MYNQVNSNSNTKHLYDLTMVNKMCRDKQELVLKMVNVFILEISKSLEEITVAAQKDNIEKIKNEIHKVKPTLTYYGTAEIKKELLNLESLILGNLTTKELETSISSLDKITKQTVAKVKNDFGISNN